MNHLPVYYGPKGYQERVLDVTVAAKTTITGNPISIHRQEKKALSALRERLYRPPNCSKPSVKRDRSYPWPFNHPRSRPLLLCSGEHARYMYAAAITPYLMYMVATYPGSPGRNWRRSSGVRKDRAKEKVLNDGELSEHFGLVHLDHTLVDLVPGFYLRMKDGRRALIAR